MPTSSSTPAQKRQAKTWVQSILAIATGYLFLALGVLVIMGILTLQGVKTSTPSLILLLTLLQLSLATGGGYITALLSPAEAMSQPTDLIQHSLIRQGLIRHGMGLAILVLVLWLVAAITGNEPWSIQLLNLATAFMGISTGTWLRLRQQA